MDEKRSLPTPNRDPDALRDRQLPPAGRSWHEVEERISIGPSNQRLASARKLASDLWRIPRLHCRYNGTLLVPLLRLISPRSPLVRVLAGRWIEQRYTS